MNISSKNNMQIEKRKNWDTYISFLIFCYWGSFKNYKVLNKFLQILWESDNEYNKLTNSLHTLNRYSLYEILMNA